MIVKACAAKGNAHAPVRSARRDTNRLGDRIESRVNVRNGFQVGFERPQLFVLQLHMKIVGQGAAQFGFDFCIGLARRSAEETIKDLLLRDRIAVTAENIGVRAARDDLAVDQHAVAIEDDEIESQRMIRDNYVLSSSSGTQYSSSR